MASRPDSRGLSLSCPTQFGMDRPFSHRSSGIADNLIWFDQLGWIRQSFPKDGEGAAETKLIRRADFLFAFRPRQGRIQVQNRRSVMLGDPLFFVAAIAALAVLVILMVGIGGFARGGEFNKRNANRIMRLRVAAQALAVMLILIFVIVRGAGG